jgi:hypothetical protein
VSGGIAPLILTSVVDGGKWLTSRLGRWIGNWMGPTAGFEKREERNLAPARNRTVVDQPVAPSVYRLSSPDSSASFHLLFKSSVSHIHLFDAVSLNTESVVI